MTTMKAVLSIAGSDPSGGAGLQADIKTIAAHRLFAETAVTVLTIQNTTGVFGLVPVSPDDIARQIDVVFDDIRPDAVKIGVVPTPEAAEAIARALVRAQAGKHRRRSRHGGDERIGARGRRGGARSRGASVPDRDGCHAQHPRSASALRDRR